MDNGARGAVSESKIEVTRGLPIELVERIVKALG
jgi:hypothetical protein